MRATWTILGLILMGCGPPRHAGRVVVGVDPPPETEVRAVTPAHAAPVVVDWSQRTGRWAGPAPLARAEVVWSNILPGPIVHPITTDGDTIYAVAAGNVYALDPRGIKRWTARIQAAGPAVVSEAGIIVPREDGRLVLLDPDSGAVVKETGPGGLTHGIPTVLEGVMAWVTTDGVLATSDGGRQRIATAGMSDIASDGQWLYVGTLAGELMAVDRSGILWSQRLPGPAVAHPVVSSDTVYMTYGARGSTPGGVAAVSREDGALRWTSSMRSGPSAGPALGNVLVVPGKSGELVAMDIGHGGIRWRTPGYGPFTVKPLLVGGTVFAGNADGRVHRVDLDDGGEAWALDLGATITGDPILIQGHLVFGLTDGRLVCLR